MHSEYVLPDEQCDSCRNRKHHTPRIDELSMENRKICDLENTFSNMYRRMHILVLGESIEFCDFGISIGYVEWNAFAREAKNVIHPCMVYADLQC